MILKQFYLEPIHDSHVSFYKKAFVITELDRVILYSYGTRVAEYLHVEEGLDKLIVYGLWSNTTVRHIREFFYQVGLGFISIDALRDIIEEKGVYI